jgi:hypothetical protein
MKMSPKKHFIIGAILIAALIGLFFIGDDRTRTALEISLVSPLTLGHANMDFLILNPKTGSWSDVTGRCYRAEVQIKNDGHRGIGFPSSALYELQIQIGHSTQWQTFGQRSLTITHKPIHPGASEKAVVFIPVEAERWRLHIPYIYWSPFIAFCERVFDKLQIPLVISEANNEFQCTSQKWEVDHSSIEASDK